MDIREMASQEAPANKVKYAHVIQPVLQDLHKVRSNIIQNESFKNFVSYNECISWIVLIINRQIYASAMCQQR